MKTNIMVKGNIVVRLFVGISFIFLVSCVSQPTPCGNAIPWYNVKFHWDGSRLVCEL